MEFIRIINENVDLEGYSSSKNWIGYFDLNEKYIHKNNERMISFFIDYFSIYINEFVIVSSLYYDECESLKINKKVKNIKNKLIENNIIKTINGKIYFGENQKIWENKYCKLMNSFTEIIATRELLKELSHIVISEETIGGHGHCFFVSKALKLIIYPHNEDGGYGLIGMDNKNNKYGNLFLKEAKDNNYKTYLCENFK